MPPYHQKNLSHAGTVPLKDRRWSGSGRRLSCLSGTSHGMGVLRAHDASSLPVACLGGFELVQQVLVVGQAGVDGAVQLAQAAVLVG